MIVPKINFTQRAIHNIDFMYSVKKPKFHDFAFFSFVEK